PPPERRPSRGSRDYDLEALERRLWTSNRTAALEQSMTSRAVSEGENPLNWHDGARPSAPTSWLKELCKPVRTRWPDGRRRCASARVERTLHRSGATLSAAAV